MPGRLELYRRQSDITELVRHRSEKWEDNDGIQIQEYAGGTWRLEEMSVIEFIRLVPF